MLTVPTDLPDVFSDFVERAHEVVGELIIFRPDDEIAYASADAVRRYPFLADSTSLSFADLFWQIVNSGMVDAAEMRLTPSDHLQMAVAVRRANDVLDFHKAYRGASLICQHRRLPSGWSAQLRVNIDALRVAGSAPLSVTEAIERARETTRLSSALNRLPVGVLYVTGTGCLRWRNAAAADLLATSATVGKVGQPVAFADAGAQAAFSDAIARVFRTRVTAYVLIPVAGEPRLASVAPAPYVDELLILFAPDKAGDEDLDDALSAFGLSPAERRIATAVGHGQSPAEVSLSTGRSRDTVRCQLKGIYKKLGLNMGVASQRTLARLIGQVTSISGFSRSHRH